ncbi:MAG: hypothetical protein CMM93_06970 [Rickettsiales bacterium]|nr:hypothetical protein [Rickettsiales bacterium]|tara:strand:- start:2420 stop:2737 length:318 start_codon:yes stop_codon:yes gene_type:complete
MDIEFFKTSTDEIICSSDYESKIYNPSIWMDMKDLISDGELSLTFQGFEPDELYLITEIILTIPSHLIGHIAIDVQEDIGSVFIPIFDHEISIESNVNVVRDFYF